jgi:ribosomal protein L22
VAVAPPRQEVKASSKYVRTSPRKARLVVEHIRGRSVPEARTVLAFTPRAVARDIEKLLKAAVANAEANHGLIGDDLRVSAAYVDEGPVFKRWRARARGRAARIRKRTCHITLKLSPTEEVAVSPAESATAAEKPKRSPRRKAAQPKAEKKADEPKAEAKPKRRTPAKKPSTTRKTKET